MFVVLMTFEEIKGKVQASIELTLKVLLSYKMRVRFPIGKRQYPLLETNVSPYGNVRILGRKQEFPLMETKGNYTTLIIRCIDKHQLYQEKIQVIGDRYGDRLLQPVTKSETPMNKGFSSCR